MRFWRIGGRLIPICEALLKPETYVIGVDMGATKIAAALVASNGDVLATVQRPTAPQRGVDPVLVDISQCIDELAAQSPRPVAGVGIGSPGQVITAEGKVYSAVNLGWDEVPLADGVRSRLANDLPVWILKDTNASVLGEYYFGAARGCPDFIYLGIGSGLGGGVLANGDLVTGKNGTAAEVGHLSLDPHGRRCACGLQGCAETVISGPGLVAETRELMSKWAGETQLSEDAALSPALVLKFARQGDPLANLAVAHLAEWLGIVMAASVALLNPARFILGGGVALAGFDLIAEPALTEMKRRVLSNSYHDLTVVPSGLESSAVGAACLVWHQNRKSIEGR